MDQLASKLMLQQDKLYAVQDPEKVREVLDDIDSLTRQADKDKLLIDAIVLRAEEEERSHIKSEQLAGEAASYMQQINTEQYDDAQSPFSVESMQSSLPTVTTASSPPEPVVYPASTLSLPSGVSMAASSIITSAVTSNITSMSSSITTPAVTSTIITPAVTGVTSAVTSVFNPTTLTVSYPYGSHHTSYVSGHGGFQPVSSSYSYATAPHTMAPHHSIYHNPMLPGMYPTGVTMPYTGTTSQPGGSIQFIHILLVTLGDLVRFLTQVIHL